MVDAVTEVLPVQEREIETAPEFGTRVDTCDILGMAKIEGAVKILLDTDGVLTEAEIDALAEAG